MSARSTNIVAEMACSHEGDPVLARRIIDAAAAAGADAVQLQMWVLPEMVVPHHPDYPKLQRLELSEQTWRDLARYAREQHPRLGVLACVYETASVALAQSIGVDGYKIHSGDLSNPTLLRSVAATGKPVHLSIGSSTVDEITEAVGTVTEHGSDVVLMYGFQSFPTPIEDVNLAYLPTLRGLFDRPVGYQDHCDADAPEAFWIPAAAAGMGIDVIEKHVTHDRRLKGIDHESALNPDELATFVRMIRAVDRSRGSATPRLFSEAERRYRAYSKKSLVATRALEAGHVLAADDVRPMRADRLGVPPVAIATLVGKRLRRPTDALHVIAEADVE
jgi:sialic acid synthase SpsE